MPISSPRNVSLLALAGALALGSADAEACGGLFCSTNNPVNQAAERIIFAKNDDGTVTAAIEILYEGDANSFAWVFPVPDGETKVGLSSKQAFDALQGASNPIYRLQQVFPPECPPPPIAFAAGAPLAESAPNSPAPAVEVVDSGAVGPYVYDQIKVNPDLPNRADVAVEWLEQNGYDAQLPELLEPYLQQDMNLLAFKLNKDSSAGSVRPVLVTYNSDTPSIPLRPTAVAASPDMGVLVWLLGDARAVPDSGSGYYHLVLNEALIDWFNPGQSYNDVVNAAADEAGLGFVTEQAGDAEAFINTVYPENVSAGWEKLVASQPESLEAFLMQAQAVASTPQRFIGGGFAGPVALTPGGNQYDGFIDVLSNPQVLPLRAGATAEQLNMCISCYFAEETQLGDPRFPETAFDPATDPILNLDRDAFLEEMRRLVIEPLEATQQMFKDHAKVTRLYTTMSAEDMVRDPVFTYNPDLEDYSNVHQAEQVMMCTDQVQRGWEVKLPQGMIIKGEARTWPISVADALPANLRIEETTSAGPARLIIDSAQELGEALEADGVGAMGTLMEGTVVEPTPVEAPMPPDEQPVMTPPAPPEVEPPVKEELPPSETATPPSPEEPMEAMEPPKEPAPGEPEMTKDEEMAAEQEQEQAKELVKEMTDTDSEQDSGGCSVADSRSSRTGGLAGFAFLTAALALGRRRRS